MLLFTYLILFILLFSLTLCQNSISISNRSINSLTSYQIKLTFNFTSLSPSGKLTITFPSAGYSTAQLTSSQCSPYTCQHSSLSLTINNSLIPSSQNTTLLISNIINPGNTLSAVAQNISVTFTTTTGNQTVQLAIGTFTSGALQSCSISFATSVVNTYSIATITVKNTNQVGNGHLQVTFPSYWSGSAVTTNQILANSYGCGSYSCTYTQSFYNVLTVNNITMGANSSIDMSVSTILSPPLSVINNEIQVATTSLDGNLIDSSVSCSIAALSAKTFTLNSSVGGTTVWSNFSPALSFVSGDPIKVGDVIYLTKSSFIETVTMSSLSLASTVINSSMNLISSTQYQYNLTSSGSTTFIPSGSTINLTGLTFKSVSYSTSIPSAFTLTFSRNGYNYQTGSVAFTATPNTISSISISSNNNTVQRSTTVDVTFTIIAPLTSASMIIISIPSSITVYECGNRVTVNGNVVSFVCNKNTSDHSLMIQNFTFVDLTTANITVRVNITNPMTTQPTTFSISTIFNSSIYNKTSGLGITDQGTISYISTPSTPSCSVTTNTSVIGALSLYSITCTTSSVLLSQGKVQITIPSQIIMPLSVSVRTYLNSVEVTSISSTINVTTQKITINNYLLSQNLSAGAQIIFTINSLINPQNYSTTNPFTFIFSDNNGFLIQSSTASTVTMSQPAQFSSINIQRSNNINGQPSDYQINANTSINIKSGYILKIFIPSSISVGTVSCGSSFVCGVENGNILSISFQTNFFRLQMVNITLTGLINPRTFTPTGQINFTLFSQGIQYESGTFSGLTNTLPNSIQSFTRTLISPSQSFLSSAQTLSFNITTTNSVDLLNGDYLSLTVPSSFTGDSLYCLSPYSCSLTNSVIKITSTFLQPSITFSITVVNLRTSANLSTMQSGTIFFSISSYTSDNSSIDTSNSSLRIEFTLSCNSNCQTCSITNQSQCTSCYSNSTLVDGQCNSCLEGEYKDEATGECVTCSDQCKTCVNVSTSCTSCKDDIYLISNQSKCVNSSSCPISTFPLSGLCQSCDPSCSSCENTTTSCLTCSSTYTKKNLTSSQCVLSCDSGLVKYNGYCQCSQCLTCSQTYTNCTSCDPSSLTKYLYNNSCISQCPRGTYDINNICFPCQNGCSVCTNEKCLDSVEQSLTSGKIIPVPFTLAVIVVIILAVMSKVIAGQSFIPGFVISIGGIVQVMSWVVVLVLVGYEEMTMWKRMGIVLISIGIGINYLLNIAQLPLIYKYLYSDKSFHFWWRKQSSPCHNRLSILFSSLFHHRYIHLLFSKSFSSPSLSFPLSSSTHIHPIYIISGLGFLPQILTLSGCCNIAYDPLSLIHSQLFIQVIDIIVVNVIMIVFTSWNFVKRDDEFFKGREVVKYEDREVFRNNQTLEEMKDQYLENLEIEDVVGGVGRGMGGGKGKYLRTRLHLEGLEEKVLDRNRGGRRMDGMGKIGGELNVDYQLVKKISGEKERDFNKKNTSQKWQLDGISQSNQQFYSSSSINSQQPLSPSKQSHNPRTNVLRTNFQQKASQLLSNNLEIDPNQQQISISDDSLVRYEIPLDTEDVDVIFSPLRKSVGVAKQEKSGGENGEVDDVERESVLVRNSELNKQLTARKIKIKRKNKKRKQERNNNANNNNGQSHQNNSQDNSNKQSSHPSISDSSVSDQQNQNSSQLQSQTVLQNYRRQSHDDVPSKPSLLSPTQQHYRIHHENSSPTNFDNIVTNSIEYNDDESKYGLEEDEKEGGNNGDEEESEKTKTFFLGNEGRGRFENLGSGGKKVKMHQTTNEFRKQKRSLGEVEFLRQKQDRLNDIQSGYDYQTVNNLQLNNKQKPKPQFFTSTPINHQLPQHKFQRYFQYDSDSILGSQPSHNRLIQKRQTISSLGSIKKNIQLKDDMITRSIVSKSILAPETPIKIPNVQISSQFSSNATEPLSTIVEKPVGVGRDANGGNEILNKRLKSVEKIYLQKLQIKDNNRKS